MPPLWEAASAAGSEPRAAAGAATSAGAAAFPVLMSPPPSSERASGSRDPSTAPSSPRALPVASESFVAVNVRGANRRGAAARLRCAWLSIVFF